MTVLGIPLESQGLTAQPLLNTESETDLCKTSPDRITELVRGVIDKKQENKVKTLSDKWERYSPSLIGGDLFNFLYFGLEAAKSFMPALQAVAAIGIATLACGVTGGLINIAVASISWKNGIQALKNGDKVTGGRLIFDACCYSALGVFMILTSVSSYAAAGGSLALFLAANPYIIPVLFLAASIPLIAELCYRNANILQKSDMGSLLKLDKLEALLKSEDEPDWEEIDKLYSDQKDLFNLSSLENLSESDIVKELSKKMEDLQSDMGVDAGLEVFELLELIKKRNHKEALEKLKTAKEKIAEWNSSLKVRSGQQALYVAGFAICMLAVSAALGVSPNILYGVQNASLFGANFIPFCTDVALPLKRNTPMVVPHIFEKDKGFTPFSLDGDVNPQCSNSPGP